VHTLNGIDARDLQHERAVDAGGRVTVMLAGEHPMKLARIRSELERHGFIVVAQAMDADQAIEAARDHQPELCLLHIDMPGGGIVAADRISLELPNTRIAVLSGEPQPDQLRKVILAGADGFLPASTSPERLTAALNGLVKGEAALTRAMTGQLVREYRQFASRSSDVSVLLTGASFDNPLPPRSRFRYLPRLWRHYRHRRHGGMPASTAWASARARMADYS
jgi:DNA-binding NarL/FixJ family response regulator